MVPAVLTTPVDPVILRDEACELAAILRLFRSGRLIMDEVDLILHPLKVKLKPQLVETLLVHLERAQLSNWTQSPVGFSADAMATCNSSD